MAKAPKKLDDLFHDTLKDIYFAEKKILTALPKMAKAAHDEDLKAAFEKHHAETETHVSRLEQVFSAIDAKPQGKTCDAIMGIIEEGQEIMKEYKGSPALDAGPLLELDNVILTPHWSASTTDVWQATGRAMAEGMLKAACGVIPENVVNQEAQEAA